MSNNYITKPIKDRVFSHMKEKGVTSSDLCRILNVNYCDFKATFDGKSACYGKWQKKISETLGVSREELFAEFYMPRNNDGTIKEALMPYDVEDIEDLIRNVKNKTIAPFEREIAILNRVELTERNLACFVFRIREIIEQMKEGTERMDGVNFHDEMVRNMTNPTKDAEDLLLQAYKRGVEEGKGYLEQIRWERDVAISQLEDIGASCGLNMSLWLTEHDKEVIRKFAEWIAHNHKYNPMKEDIGFAWSDNAHFSTVDEVIAEYEKEQKGEQT